MTTLHFEIKVEDYSKGGIILGNLQKALGFIPKFTVSLDDKPENVESTKYSHLKIIKTAV